MNAQSGNEKGIPAPPVVTRARILSIGITIAYIVLSNYVLPLPNQVILLPFVILSGYSAASFSESAGLIFHYLRIDFNRGVVLSLLLVGFLTWTFSVFIPGMAVQFVAYTMIFYLTSGLTRSTFEATSFVFREDLDRSLKLYRAFAVSRLTFYLATPLIAVALASVSVVTAIQVGIFIALAFWIQETLDRPVTPYLLGGERIVWELKVLQTLRRRPLTEGELRERLSPAKNQLERVLADMLRRGLVKREGKKWEVGRAYRPLLDELEARRRRLATKVKRAHTK